MRCYFVRICYHSGRNQTFKSFNIIICHLWIISSLKARVPCTCWAITFRRPLHEILQVSNPGSKQPSTPHCQFLQELLRSMPGVFRVIPLGLMQIVYQCSLWPECFHLWMHQCRGLPLWRHLVEGNSSHVRQIREILNFPIGGESVTCHGSKFNLPRFDRGLRISRHQARYPIFSRITLDSTRKMAAQSYSRRVRQAFSISWLIVIYI